MRTIGLLFVATVFSAGGCSWATFDDLGNEMWVDSVGGAEGVNPQDFLGVAAPGETTETGAVFLALGRSTDSVGSYSYDADGARATVGVEIRAGTLGFGPLAPEVVIAGDPYSNIVGVAAVTGAVNDQDTKLANFPADDVTSGVDANDFNNAGVLDGPIQATGLVYARTDDDLADLTLTDAVLARGNQIALIGDYASSTGQTISGCFGATDTDIVMSVAAGNFDPGDDDDEIVAVINDLAGTAPQIIIFNGSVIRTTWTQDMTALRTCFDDLVPERAALARLNGIAADPDFGHRMVVGDFDGDGAPDIAISSPASETVRVYINTGSFTFTEVEPAPPAEAGEFGASLAAGDLDGVGGDELIVGAPQANIDGANHAGTVTIYSFDGTTFNERMILHDIQPETEQQFGRGVAVVPWAGSTNVLTVAGDHEIFTYFRTQLYDDVRQ